MRAIEKARFQADSLALNAADQACMRLLLHDDLPALEWDGEFAHFRRMYLQVYKRMLAGLALMWVVELPGHGVVGQAFVQFTSKADPSLANGKTRAYIHSFRIKPKFRNMGLGSKLMQLVEADLIRRGYKLVTLNVSRSNRGARRLYMRLGYRVMEKDPGRWSYHDEKGVLQHVNEPGWRMEKRLEKVTEE
ncbi:MAG: GNAT family N-acetyltransferase [Anaerolineae bacterium]|nr:GNAT family N-acetyltransferase [Anaerolineae bacterium]